MQRIELSQGFEPRIDQLSKKVRELRENSRRSVDGLDSAMDAVEQNGGRRDAADACMSLRGLSSELLEQGADIHGLDPARVADLISDPFADE